MRNNTLTQINRLGMYMYAYFNGLANPNSSKLMVVDDFGVLVDTSTDAINIFM